MEDKSKIPGILAAAVISHFVSFLLDRILLVDWREVTFTSKELYIDRPGGWWELLIFYLALALILTLLFYIFLSWFQKKHHLSKKLVIISLGILITVGSLSISLSLGQLMPIAKVEYKTEITGRIENLESYNYLFVRPIDSAQCWLQNPVPLQPDNYGKWRTAAFFGGSPGTKFELIIISSDTVSEQFSKPGGYDCNRIPGHLKRFVRVVNLK